MSWPLIDALESGASVDLGSIGILGCWVPDPDSPIDFVAQSVTAPSNTFRGSQIPVTSSFTNNGSAASTAFSVGVYFSADQTITSEDVFAGFACTVSSLAPGEVGTCNGLATVPNLLPGDYYAGLLVDFQNHIVESIETNNGVSTGHLTSVAPNPLDPIVNGSFETGDLAGWTVKELTQASNPNLPISVRGAGVEYPAPTFQAPPYILDYFTSAPTHGQWAVLHDFNGDDPLTSGFVNRRELYQDVTLPAGTTTLEFDYRAAWELFRFSSTQDRTFNVELEPAGGGSTLLDQTILVAPNLTHRGRHRQPLGRRGRLPAWQHRPERLRRPERAPEVRLEHPGARQRVRVLPARRHPDQRERDPGQHATRRDPDVTRGRIVVRDGHVHHVRGNRQRRGRRRPQRQPCLDVQCHRRPDWNRGQLLDQRR